jgi:hypothetical protein
MKQLKIDFFLKGNIIFNSLLLKGGFWDCGFRSSCKNIITFSLRRITGYYEKLCILNIDKSLMEQSG